MGRFVRIWVGQLGSGVGSALTAFALAVSVYEATGSATKFALIVVAASVPALVMAPLAGALVDRHDRASLIRLADLAGAGAALLLAWQLGSGRFELWQVYPFVALASVLSVLRLTAFTALTSSLVPPAELGRATGLAEAARVIPQVAGPLLGGVLVTHLSLSHLVLIDAATYLAAVALTGAPSRAPTSTVRREALGSELTHGLRYVLERPGLLGLLLLYSWLNLWVSCAEVLLTPFVLDRFQSPALLGSVMGAGGVGMVLGAVTVGAWGGPRRKLRGVLSFALVTAAAFALVGLFPRPGVLLLGAFAALFCVPVINGCGASVWQLKVPHGEQGRVLSVRMMVSWAGAPLGQLVAGPLYRTTSLLLSSGWAFLLLGLAVASGVALAWLHPRLRNVEAELPDALPGAAAGAGT